MNRAEGESVIVVWTTLPSDSAPREFAGALVQEGLAACVTIVSGLTSVYRWEDAIEDAEEYQLTIKTTVAKLEALERRLTELHPYDLPEFLVSPAVGGSSQYLDWVRSSTV